MRVEAGDWFALPKGAKALRPLWAIGDIHGCTDQLTALYDHLRARVTGAALLVHLGDYVDRGRDSAGALSMVAAGPGIAGLEQVDLRGNHDLYLINAAGLDGDIDPALVARWLRNGGKTTLNDLGVSAAIDDPEQRAARLRAALGPERIALLRRTKLMHREGEIVFVHAGLNPARGVAQQTPHDLMWIREVFFECSPDAWPFDDLVIHGHSPRAFGLRVSRINSTPLASRRLMPPPMA